ncbi:DUF3131 domain-containing protein [Boseongicola aestuarii]|uniref:DUF3131 domain-containing protein n=1 Tax=Boseongicola aestuarii TaxID=1470561 RepID=A0A238IX33_9RHOB|nr:DUF3131 domain-containing protein [Boseongicola aestuarii]SMX22542.1 hypothetical protein BOA8489_00639 [Boseongicola aestuarii]
MQDRLIFTRRHFMGTALSGATLGLAIPPGRALSAGSKPVMVLLDDIPPDTSASQLFSFLDPILSLNIAVGCLVRLDARSQLALQENPELLAQLLTLTADYPGLTQLIPYAPDLGAQTGYMQMRLAGDVQSAYLRLVEPLSGDIPPDPLLTIATDLPDGTLPVIRGVRSAGFRSVLLLPRTASASSIWLNADGVQQVQGGLRLAANPGRTAITEAVLREIETSDTVVVVAGFPKERDLSDDGYFRAGATLGDGVSLALANGGAFQTLPSDLVLKSGDLFRRFIVLCVRDSGTDEGAQSLTDALTAQGLKYTLLRDLEHNGDQSPDTSGSAPTCWLAASDRQQTPEELLDAVIARAAGTAREADRLDLSCLAIGESTSATDTEPLQGLDVLIDLVPERHGALGLDANGILRLPAQMQLVAGGTMRRLGLLDGDAFEPLRDAIILLQSDAFNSAQEIETAVSALKSLSASEDVTVTDVAGYVEAVTVRDQAAALLKAARRIPTKLISDVAGDGSTESLMRDARLAWSYFDRLTDPSTGLVPATAWLEDGNVQSYDFATMWDTASVILATISAHSLGLIDTVEFRSRLTLLLASLADQPFAGLNLPAGLSSTRDTSLGDKLYDASDTSRLLTALKVLAGYSPDDFPIEEIVSRWDLAMTLRDGVPQTASGLRFKSAFRSNYASYLGRGFDQWGFEIASPYDVSTGLSGLDAQVAVLHAAARMGPIGTEPHLLEAVEMGFSEPAYSMSEALFAAQFAEYQKTGQLVCVSEAPINREPWFIYQGFQLGDVEVPWTVETLDPSPRFKTRGFRRAVSMVNTKSAYLWHFVRPGDYTSKLVDHVRQNAAIPSLGFAPGVPSVPTVKIGSYSDVNTNGVVLQAIAYALNGARPAVEWRA